MHIDDPRTYYDFAQYLIDDARLRAAYAIRCDKGLCAAVAKGHYELAEMNRSSRNLAVVAAVESLLRWVQS
ncbi:MAG: hypothetical protein WC211_00650 [Dehalococcoidia bacterium]